MHQSTALKPRPAADAVPPPRLLMEAIARRVRIAATYNGTVSKLAPHVLYTRAGELYLAGVVTERNGAPPKEPKLGIFKLDGLSDLAIVDQPFAPDRALFDPADPRFAATTVFAVEL